VDDDDDRIAIDVSRPDLLHEHADEAVAALAARNDPTFPRVMVRGNELIRRTERGELEAFTKASLRDELSRIIIFCTTGKEGERVPVKVPSDVVDTILARDSAEYAGIARVDRVIDVPVLGADGRLIDTPGHHPGSRVLYVPDPDLDLPATVGEIGTHEDVWHARDLLMDELLGDFGFEDEASKANALALLILPFVREYIGDHPTPMHLVTAPEVGSGKTLLARTALVPGCGVVDLMANVDDEDEMRKRITSSLLAGRQAVVLDNINDIASGVLAGAITTGRWADRKLGESREVRLSVRNVWVATGNNVGLTSEHNRRAVPIILDPGDVRPSDRPKQAFRHANLEAWARENRGKLVDAALTLVRNWQNGTVQSDGSVVPQAAERTLGSFERWAEVVGGILAAAGVKGFLGNRDKLMAMSSDEREIAQWFEAWRQLQRGPVSLEELTDLCTAPNGLLYDALPEHMRASRSDVKKQLQFWLRANKGAKYGALKLVKQDGRPNRWDVTAL